MSERAALLEAIEAAPGDDAPRLRYADWLERQGGEEYRQRAEFIRLQCSMAQPGGRTETASRREAELLVAVRPRVLGILDDPSALVHQALELRRVSAGFAGDMIAALHPPDTDVKAVFRRGFLAHLTLDAALFVLAASALASLRPRPKITVTGLAAYLRAFLECEHRVLVSGIHVQTVGDRFRVALNTHWLRLAFGGTESWPRLETLDLSSCSLGNGDGRVVIDSERLPSLTDLNLGRNYLDRHLLRYLTGTPRWRSLLRLSWAGNDCGHYGAEALLAAADVNRLLCLDLAGCGIGPHDAQRLMAKYGARVQFGPAPNRD